MRLLLRLSRLSAVLWFRSTELLSQETGAASAKCWARRRDLQPEVFQDRRGGTRLVERVKMNARRAHTKQFPALIRRVFDAVLRGRFVVVGALFEFGQQRFGQIRPAQS